MVDSCIGGKSSINVGPHKNLIGTFHPPQSVIIDPQLASSLNTEQLIGGLIEAAKICYCRGNDAFQEYIQLQPSVSMSIDQLERIVTCSLTAKKWFIESDEFDKAERLHLNFGHTFGHAIEGASHFHIPHGIGVAVGILCAIELGRRTGRRYIGIARIRILEEYLHSLLAEIQWLRKDLADLCVQNILNLFESDKKHGIDHYSVILIAESGAVEVVRLAKDENTRQNIRRAIENAFEAISGRK
jgi:3-dehydroquinate synthase